MGGYAHTPQEDAQSNTQYCKDEWQHCRVEWCLWGLCACVDKVNAADSNIFATEKQLKEYGDKIPADKKSAIEGALAKLKEAHKNQDVAAIDTAITELNNAWQAASQDLYAAQQAQQQAQGGAQQGAASDAGAQGGAQQPEDVEFEEVK